MGMTITIVISLLSIALFIHVTIVQDGGQIMSFTAHAEAPPLREDSSGAIRVGKSRVLLELVIHAFEDGATPEAIVQRYETLSLSDVYAVIAYYLRHGEEIVSYLKRREEQAIEVRERIERNQDVSEIRARLLARQQPE